MTGNEFKEMRTLWGLRLDEIRGLLGYKTIGGYRYHEDGNRELPIIFDIFFNYVNRYGLKEAKKEFKKRFKNNG